MSSSNIQDFHIHNPVTRCLVATRQFRIADIHFWHQIAKILYTKQRLCFAKNHAMEKRQSKQRYTLTSQINGNERPVLSSRRSTSAEILPGTQRIEMTRMGNICGPKKSPPTEPNPDRPLRKLVNIQTRLAWLTSKSNIYIAIIVYVISYGTETWSHPERRISYFQPYNMHFFT